MELSVFRSALICALLMLGAAAEAQTPTFNDVITSRDVQFYGCVGDGVADDTACVQAAISGAAGRGTPLFFDGVHKYNITAPLTSAQIVDLEGFASIGNTGPHTNTRVCPWGIVSTANTDVLQLAGDKVIVRNLCIQMAPVGSIASAGAAIRLGGIDQQHSVIEGNTIFRPYDGIVIAGLGYSPNSSRDGAFSDNVIRAPNHIGISVGAGTTGGVTGGNSFNNNRIGCEAGIGPNGVGFAMFDGAITWNATNLGPNNCAINFEIIPGANQNANGMFTGNIGDAAGTNCGGCAAMGLYVEPQDPTAVISFLNFSRAWVGSVQPNDTPIKLANSHGGTCNNILFTGLILHSGTSAGQTQTNIVDIEGCYNITISGSTIDQWISATGTTTNGILIAGNGANEPTHIAITGNHIGVFKGTLTNGINIQTDGTTITPTYLAITGNEIGNATNPIVTNLTQSSTNGRLWVIGNNEDVDDQCPTVASATATAIPGAATCIHLTGTTTITSLYPTWRSRKLTLIANSGLSLNTGGAAPGMCTNLTIPAVGAAYFWFNDGSNCWAHQ